MSHAAKLIDMTILIVGTMDELHRHGYIEGALKATVRTLAQYDQLMAAPWRPKKKEVENHLIFVLDSFGVNVDEVVRDFWLLMIWRWLNGEFDEQKASEHRRRRLRGLLRRIVNERFGG